MGAAILVSAAGGAAMLGEGLSGAPTPAPEVPDVVVIVHEAVRLADGATPGGVHSAGGGGRDGGGSRYGGAGGSGAGGGFEGGWQLGPWVSSWGRGEHRAAVEEARRAIARGDVYQVNVVGHASAPYLGDPRAALEAVANLPGAAWAGMIEGAGWAVASGSPECLVTVSGGRVTTRPIKGTAPRTEAGRAALFASAKERAEHIMIVDLARNDLGRIATTGSVEVEELFAVRPWSGLWQAESTVSATLRPGVGVAELLRAVCPGASVTGAPKRAALEVLTRLEPVGRGPAMGALGYVTRQGIELGLTIRTVAAVAGPPTAGSRVAGPAGRPAPGPAGRSAPAPGGGSAPAPGGGSAPAPGGGSVPAPAGGSVPTPGGGHAGNPGEQHAGDSGEQHAGDSGEQHAGDSGERRAGNSGEWHAGDLGERRAGTLHLWAGGGITWSSDPDDEVAEAAAKAAPLDAALRGASRALVPATAGRREKDGTEHPEPAGR